MPAPAPEFVDEADRLRVLADFHAETLQDDPELQAIVEFAAKLCKAPASMVTLLDDKRQFFVTRTGVEERETPRSVSFCSHALGSAQMLEVSDTTKDTRFADNPMVTGAPGVRYYAGQPLISTEGAPLGTLCVIDIVPRAKPLNQFQREGMAVLAQAAMRRLRARRQNLAAEREIQLSEEKFRALADSMPDIAFSTDAQGNFDYLNQRWREFTGFDDFGEEVAPRVLHPDESEEIKRDWLHSVATGEPYEKESRLRRADGTWRWVLARAVPVYLPSGERVRWFGTITDIDGAHKLSEARDMLAKELSHRIKNIFAVVTGLVTLQARKSPDHQPFAEALVKTLGALGRAHEFVRPAGGSTRESLQGLLEVLFAPYTNGEGEMRVRIGGEDCRVSQAAATPLALVFHELATNSAKYGALSADEGHVTLDVADKGDEVELLWTEHGGPQPKEGGATGFGSRLVEMAVTGQLQGQWERSLEPTGLVAKLTLSKAAIAP